MLTKLANLAMKGMSGCCRKENEESGVLESFTKMTAPRGQGLCLFLGDGQHCVRHRATVK